MAGGSVAGMGGGVGMATSADASLDATSCESRDVTWCSSGHTGSSTSSSVNTKPGKSARAVPSASMSTLGDRRTRSKRE